MFCTGYTALYTCFNNWLQSVPAGTCYTALYTCFNNRLQSLPAGTCYTALYTCFSNWLQSVPAGTGYTAFYTCFNNWLECTGWYWLHSLVHLLQPTGYKSTNRVLATQSLLYRTSPQLVTLKKKKKKRAGSI